MKKINNLTENFEDELETILLEEGITSKENMVYEDQVLAREIFFSKEEEINFVKNECISFVDENNIYICKDDGSGDFGVQKIQINKYSYLLELLEENEETSSDDSFSVDFKVQWNKNPQVYFEGYVNIPGGECEDEDIDWYYYDANGFTSSQIFIEHEGVDWIKGATTEQKWEVEQFKNDFLEVSFWIDECICQSDAGENSILSVKNCTVIVG